MLLHAVALGGGSVLLHALSARLYSSYCAPLGAYTIFIPLMEETWHCYALRQTLNECPRISQHLIRCAGMAILVRLSSLRRGAGLNDAA